MGFEEETARRGTPDCYFTALPQELEGKRDRIASNLQAVGLAPIIPQVNPTNNYTPRELSWLTANRSAVVVASITLQVRQTEMRYSHLR